MGRKKKFENQPEIIIDVAERLFSKNGYAKTTMDDIAREVGIGKATLYGDFASKEAILLAVIHRFEKTMLDTMVSTIRRSKAGALETIQEAMLKDFLLIHDIVKQHHANELLFEEASVRMGKDFQDTRNRVEKQKQEMIGELLKVAIRQGEIRPVENLQAVTAMLFTAQAGVKTTMYERTRAENQRLLAEMLALLLCGLKTDGKLAR